MRGCRRSRHDRPILSRQLFSPSSADVRVSRVESLVNGRNRGPVPNFEQQNTFELLF